MLAGLDRRALRRRVILYVNGFKAMMLVALLAIPLALLLRKPRAVAPGGAAAEQMD
ncbi:MAG: hypothetical protein ABIK36_17655 [Pseudomonadota bacterium]